MKLTLKKLKDKYIDLYSLRVDDKPCFQIQVVEGMLLIYEITSEIHWPKVLWIPYGDGDEYDD